MTHSEPRDYKNRSYVGEFGAAATDDYQIKMMYALWKAKKAGLVSEDDFSAETTFHLSVREYPKIGFKTRDGQDTRSSYWLISGMQFIRELVEGYGWNEETLRRLAQYKVKGEVYYDPEFIEFLRNDKPHFTIEGLPDGELGFARESLLTVKCPRYQKQLFETPSLNIVNASLNPATLISHAVKAANGKGIIDMSLRRSNDLGGLATTLATMVGGAVGTSNVLAYELYGIPLIGTMAHAWVMDFPTEEEAFDVWTEVQRAGMRGYLVDTRDAVQGVKNVIASCKKYGVKPDLVRNDSGDQVAFSAMARALLNEAGFHDCIIINTNDMNAAIIHGLEKRGVENNGYGVGTWQCAQPSPGAVYKQAMTVYADGTVLESMKMSDEFKSTFPGAQRTLRILGKDEGLVTDVMVPYRMDVGSGILTQELTTVRLTDKAVITYPSGTRFYNPHIKLCTDGQVHRDTWPTVMESAAFARENLQRLPDKHRDLENPEPYPVCVEGNLFKRFRDALAQNEQSKVSRATPQP